MIRRRGRWCGAGACSGHGWLCPTTARHFPAAGFEGFTSRSTYAGCAISVPTARARQLSSIVDSCSERNKVTNRSSIILLFKTNIINSPPFRTAARDNVAGAPAARTRSNARCLDHRVARSSSRIRHFDYRCCSYCLHSNRRNDHDDYDAARTSAG